MHLLDLFTARRALWLLLLLLTLPACGQSGDNNGTTVIAPPPERAATLAPSFTPTETATTLPSATATPAPTFTPEPTATLEPTATATTIPSPTPTLAPTMPPAWVVLPMAQAYQRLNNCAPTTTGMVLSVYGLDVSQDEMAALQKPNAADVNVTAEEVAESIRAMGLQAFVGYSGDIALVERLLAAGFPLITEEWMNYDGGVGHFRAIRGYDRDRQLVLHNDSFQGPDRWRSYESFLQDWGVFNHKYVVPYRPEQEAQVREIIGAAWDPATNYEMLRQSSEARSSANPADGYAWWGLGEALLWQGKPEEAIVAFEQAIATGLPARYLWYRYGYFEALNRVGRYEELLAVTEPVLRQMRLSEDLRYHRAQALHALGFTQEARAELTQALRDNPRFAPAATFLAQLE